MDIEQTNDEVVISVVPEEDVKSYLEQENNKVNTQEQQDNWNTNNE